MTADEITYAGGKYDSGNSSAYYYLNTSGGSSTGNNWWWTMSPYNFFWSRTWGYARVITVRGSSDPGYLCTYVVSDTSVVRPVISLKSNTLVSGTGSATDPYVVQGLQ